MSVPCYNCERRTVNCHSTCNDYIEYKKLTKAKKQYLKDLYGVATLPEAKVKEIRTGLIHTYNNNKQPAR